MAMGVKTSGFAIAKPDYVVFLIFDSQRDGAPVTLHPRQIAHDRLPAADGCDPRGVSLRNRFQLI
jgi:hypothetical protein